MSFTVKEDAGRVVFTFPDIVVVDPNSAQEKLIKDRASQNSIVAFDLSATRAIPTTWLRLFWHIANSAKSALDKKVFVVGIKPEVARKADFIALKDQLKLVGSLEDAK